MGFSTSDIYTVSLPMGQTLLKQPRDNGFVLQTIQSWLNSKSFPNRRWHAQCVQKALWTLILLPSASSSKTFMHQASCFRHTYRDLFSQAFPTHTQPVKIKAVLHNHNDREYFRLSNSPPNSPQKNHRTHIMTTLPCLTHLSLLWNITLIIL